MKNKSQRNHNQKRRNEVSVNQCYGLQDDGFMMNAGVVNSLMNSIF